jgi:hypothetical protein
MTVDGPTVIEKANLLAAFEVVAGILGIFFAKVIDTHTHACTFTMRLYLMSSFFFHSL